MRGLGVGARSLGVGPRGLELRLQALDAALELRSLILGQAEPALECVVLGLHLVVIDLGTRARVRFQDLESAAQSIDLALGLLGR